MGFRNQNFGRVSHGKIKQRNAPNLFRQRMIMGLL